MTSIIHTLAATLPEAAGAAPLDDPPYLDLADRVVELVAAGRIGELRAFFAALETAHSSPQDAANANALQEGLMESLLSAAEYAGMSLPPIYDQLLPMSRRAWEAAWEYAHDSRWPDSSSAS